MDACWIQTFQLDCTTDYTIDLKNSTASQLLLSLLYSHNPIYIISMLAYTLTVLSILSWRVRLPTTRVLNEILFPGTPQSPPPPPTISSKETPIPPLLVYTYRKSTLKPLCTTHMSVLFYSNYISKYLCVCVSERGDEIESALFVPVDPHLKPDWITLDLEIIPLIVCQWPHTHNGHVS